MISAWWHSISTWIVARCIPSSISSWCPLDGQDLCLYSAVQCRVLQSWSCFGIPFPLGEIILESHIFLGPWNFPWVCRNPYPYCEQPDFDSLRTQADQRWALWRLTHFTGIDFSMCLILWLKSAGLESALVGSCLWRLSGFKSSRRFMHIIPATVITNWQGIIFILKNGTLAI